jgi:hypothetical protein
MKTVSFFHKDTGALHSNQLICSDDSVVAMNTPADHIAIDGHFDHLSKRVDVANPEFVDVYVNRTKTDTPAKALRYKVVDYVPPSPSDDHEWNSETKRWVIKAEVIAKAQAKAAALAQIAALEAKGVRAGREMQLGVAGAAERLADIDKQIAALR